MQGQLFNRVRKVSRDYLIWFCITYLYDWLRKLVLVSQQNRLNAKNNHDLVARVFPRLKQLTCFNSEFRLAAHEIFLLSYWSFKYCGFGATTQT